MKNAIFLSFDDNYAHFAKSCINSIISNYPNYPDLLVNYSGENKNILGFLENVKNLKLVKVSRTHDYLVGPIANQIVFDRFELWNEFELEYDNILHLDVDTIVLKNLDHLFCDNSFYAVSDTHPLTRILKIHDRSLPHSLASIFPEKMEQYIKEDDLVGIADQHKMMNAGVFVLPKRWRTPAAYAQLIYLAQRYHEHVAYADQSLISIWAMQQGLNISTEIYDNFQMVFFLNEDINIDINKIAILHFTGNSKFDHKYSGNCSPYQQLIFDQGNKIRSYYRLARENNDQVFWHLRAIKDISGANRNL